MPTTRYRLDRSVLRRYVIGDWVRDAVDAARPRIRMPVAAVGRRLSRQLAWWATRARWTMFDVLHGVDTGAGGAEKAAELPPGNIAYVPTPWTVLPRVLRLASLPVHGFSFVDIGCGKGKVLLSALQYPFTRVTGVDFSIPLCRVAERNLAAARLLRRRCVDAQVVNADAAEYVIPDGPVIFFFANPFTDEIMTRVLTNILTSYRASPRPLYLIFYAASSRVPKIEEFLRLQGDGTARQLASGLLGQRTVYVFELPGVMRQLA